MIMNGIPKVYDLQHHQYPDYQRLNNNTTTTTTTTTPTEVEIINNSGTKLAQYKPINGSSTVKIPISVCKISPNNISDQTQEDRSSLKKPLKKGLKIDDKISNELHKLIDEKDLEKGD